MDSFEKLNIAIEALLSEKNILNHKNQILQTLNTNTTKEYKEIVSLNENLKFQFQLKEKSLMDLYNIKLNEVRKENIAIAISQNHFKKINESLLEEINGYKHQKQLCHDKIIKKDEEIKKLQQETNEIESKLNEMYAKMSEYEHLINNQKLELYDMEQSIKIKTGCNHSMRRSNKFILNKRSKTIRIPSSSSPILRSGTSYSLSADLYFYDQQPSSTSIFKKIFVSEPTGNDGSNEDELHRGTAIKTNISSSSCISSTQIVQSMTTLSLDIEHDD